MKKSWIAIGSAALLGLGAWGAGAQLLHPPPERPDALMNAVTLEVIAVLKQDLAAGRSTDVAQLVEATSTGRCARRRATPRCRCAPSCGGPAWNP